MNRSIQTLRWTNALPWFILFAWAMLIGLSLYFNVKHTLDLEREMATSQAKAVVEYNKFARLWNAEHGGVYAPVDENTQPNPYLDVENRDIIGPHGIELTKINPAYMSRQMSELANEHDYLEIRLTSLRVKNPDNEPTPMEREKLLAFERGAPDGGEINSTDEHARELFYMAKFIVEPPCLKCHADQGYELGEVRGGISVSVPLSDTPAVMKPIATHLALFLGGGLLLGAGARRAGRRVSLLNVKARIDALTALPNRDTLLWHLEHEFHDARRRDHALSLLVIDIDDFKRFNDYFGHRVGDDCLRQVASTLNDSLTRPGDFVGRYGGEEFVVVLSQLDQEGAIRTAEMLRAAVAVAKIKAPPNVNTSWVTISVGVATLASDDAAVNSLFDRADAAMYQAKRRGKNQVSAEGSTESCV